MSDRSKYVCDPLDPYNDCIRHRDGTHEIRHYIFPRYYQESLFDTFGNGKWNNIDCNLSVDYEGTTVFPCSPTIIGIAHQAPEFYRYLGIRPYQRCSSGCHQIEYSYSYVSVNGKQQKLQYGKPTKMKHSKLIRVGSVYVQNGVANVRQLVPMYGKPVRDFDIRFNIHLMGYQAICTPAVAGTVVRPAITVLDEPPTESVSGIALCVSPADDGASLTIHATGFDAAGMSRLDFIKCCSRTLQTVLRKSGEINTALGNESLPMSEIDVNQQVTITETSGTLTYTIAFADGARATERTDLLKKHFQSIACDAIVLTASHVAVEDRYCFKSQNMADSFGDEPVYDIKQLRKPRLLNRHLITVSSDTMHLLRRVDEDTYEYRKLPTARYLLCEVPLNRRIYYIDADTYVADENQITHVSRDGVRRVYLSTSDHWVAMLENGVMDDGGKSFDEINIVDDIDFNGKVISAMPPLSNVTIRGSNSILCNATIETALHERHLYCGYFSKLTNCTIIDLRLGGQLGYSMVIDTDFDGVADYTATDYDKLTVGTMVGHMSKGAMTNVALNCTVIPIQFPNMKQVNIGCLAGRIDGAKIDNAVVGVGMPFVAGACDDLCTGIVAGRTSSLDLTNVFITCATIMRIFAIAKTSARLGGFVGEVTDKLRVTNCHMQPDTMAFDVDGTSDIKIGCFSATDGSVSVESSTMSLYQWTLATAETGATIGLLTPTVNSDADNLKMFNFVRPNFYRHVYTRSMAEKLRLAFGIGNSATANIQSFLLNHDHATSLIVQDITTLTDVHDNYMNKIRIPNKSNASSLFSKLKQIGSLSGLTTTQYTNIMDQWLPQLSRWLNAFLSRAFFELNVNLETNLSEYRRYLLTHAAFRSMIQATPADYLSAVGIKGYLMRNDSQFVAKYRQHYRESINSPFDLATFLATFQTTLQSLADIHATKNALVHLTELLSGMAFNSTMASLHADVMTALFSDENVMHLMAQQYRFNDESSDFIYTVRELTRQQLIYDSALSSELTSHGATFTEQQYIDRITLTVRQMVDEIENQFIVPMTKDGLRKHIIEMGNDLFERLFNHAFEYIAHYQLQQQLELANELRTSSKFKTEGNDFNLASDELFNTFLSDMQPGSLSEFKDLLRYVTNKMVKSDICQSVIAGLSEDDVAKNKPEVKEENDIEAHIAKWLESLETTMEKFFETFDEIKENLETSITDLAARFTYDELQNLRAIIMSIQDALPKSKTEVYPEALRKFNREVELFFEGENSFDKQIIELMSDMKASQKYEYKDAVSSAETTIAPTTPETSLTGKKASLSYQGTDKTDERYFIQIKPNYKQYYQYTYDDNVDGRIDLIPNEWYVISKPDNTSVTTYHTIYDVSDTYAQYKAGTLINSLSTSVVFTTSADNATEATRT